MRRSAALASLAALVALLLVRRALRRRAAEAPLEAAPDLPALAALPAGPRFVSVPWSLAAEPALGEAELAIRYRCAEGMELDRVDAQETPTQVFVTVIARWEPPAGGWFAWEQEHEATIRLAHPLGERELLHAPVDDGPHGGEPARPPHYP